MTFYIQIQSILSERQPLVLGVVSLMWLYMWLYVTAYVTLNQFEILLVAELSWLQITHQNKAGM